MLQCHVWPPHWFSSLFVSNTTGLEPKPHQIRPGAVRDVLTGPNSLFWGKLHVCCCSLRILAGFYLLRGTPARALGHPALPAKAQLRE